MTGRQRIDWRLCAWQALALATYYSAFSTTEALRLAGDGKLPAVLILLGISLVNWYALGVILAAGAQWTQADPRHRLLRTAAFIVLPGLLNGQVDTLLRYSLSYFEISALDPNNVAWLFAAWRGAVGSALFFGYCRLVHASRARRGQIERAELERAASEVRLREARVHALEQCIDPVLLQRTIAGLRAAYARERREGEALLDLLVEFLRAAMPAVRSGTGLGSDSAALGAWGRLRTRLEQLPPVPATARGES